MGHYRQQYLCVVRKLLSETVNHIGQHMTLNKQTELVFKSISFLFLKFLTFTEYSRFHNQVKNKVLKQILKKK